MKFFLTPYRHRQIPPVYLSVLSNYYHFLWTLGREHGLEARLYHGHEFPNETEEGGAQKRV